MWKAYVVPIYKGHPFEVYDNDINHNPITYPSVHSFQRYATKSNRRVFGVYTNTRLASAGGRGVGSCPNPAAREEEE